MLATVPFTDDKASLENDDSVTFFCPALQKRVSPEPLPNTHCPQRIGTILRGRSLLPDTASFFVQKT